MEGVKRGLKEGLEGCRCTGKSCSVKKHKGCHFEAETKPITA